MVKIKGLEKSTKLKGKALYSWPSRTNEHRLVAFDTENIIYFFLQNKLP
jgi:hypothetical protein